MIGTFNCVYETPCGWCSKWDKKCDKKIDISTKNCNHVWEPSNSISNAGYVYRCRKCGVTKTEPSNILDIRLSSTPVDKNCDHAFTKTNS